MNWKKKGRIFCPEGNSEWLSCYAAQVSSIEFMDFIRVYFTTRSKLNDQGYFETRITFLDCDKNDPSKILYIHDKPLLSLGLPGTFDEHGTMNCEVIFHQDKYWLYYLGWQRSSTVPYLTTLGLAISDDGKNFKKVTQGPVLGISKDVPFGVGKTSILIGNDKYHMWYTHYTPWIKHTITNENELDKITYRPIYDIRYATSLNGKDWDIQNACILPANINEAIGAPCVRKIQGKYHMWYSYRDGIDENGKSGIYKIGYAISDNKTDWQRLDDRNILNISKSGWDSEMVCYPNILSLKNSNKVYMFYSGNYYGKDGFGYAEIKV
jgi:hypothetical protein